MPSVMGCFVPTVIMKPFIFPWWLWGLVPPAMISTFTLAVSARQGVATVRMTAARIASKIVRMVETPLDARTRGDGRAVVILRGRQAATKNPARGAATAYNEDMKPCISQA